METDSKTIAEIVTDNFKAAAIFEKYGLDYCCKGKVGIDEACATKNIDPELVRNELSTLNQASISASDRFNEWNLTTLADYVVNNHHAYVRTASERLLFLTGKVATRHGDHNPDLVTIAKLFAELAAEFEHHMHKEEFVLFPFIKMLDQVQRKEKVWDTGRFGSVASPIGKMLDEHEAAGEIMAKIRELSYNYNPPAEACNTYRVTFAELAEFEKDLHQHVHLENNILFPKAIALETELRSESEIISA